MRQNLISFIRFAHFGHGAWFDIDKRSIKQRELNSVN
jgi:hypothetical protein